MHPAPRNAQVQQAVAGTLRLPAREQGQAGFQAAGAVRVQCRLDLGLRNGPLRIGTASRGLRPSTRCSLSLRNVPVHIGTAPGMEDGLQSLSAKLP